MSESKIEAGDDLHKSKRLLAEVLPLLSRHGADLGPKGFALWHEYVNGHVGLQRELAPIIKSGLRLSEQQADRLYDTHLVAPREESIVAAKVGMSSLMDKMAETIQGAAAATHAFDRCLDDFRQGLSDDEKELLGERLGDILGEGTKMRSALKDALTVMSESGDKIASISTNIADPITRDNRVRTAVSTTHVDISDRDQFRAALLEICDLASGSKQRHSLLIVEIDQMENLQDRFGDDVIAPILAEIIAVAAASTRSQDTVGELALGQLGIILPHSMAQGIERIAERIMSRVRELRVNIPGAREGVQISVSVSAAIVRNGEIPESVMGRLNRALQRAKMRGPEQKTIDQ